MKILGLLLFCSHHEPLTLLLLLLLPLRSGIV